MSDITNHDVQARLLKRIHEQFPLSHELGLQPDQNLLDSGAIDSLGLISIISLVENEFAIQVDDSDVVMENFGTVEAIARFVAARLRA